MSDKFCELHFNGPIDTQLVEARFKGHPSNGLLVAVRGKTSGAYRNAGTFQWTSAVRALCILMIRAKLANLLGVDFNTAVIHGDQGSLAASLDYALTKQPAWLRDIFGTDSTGKTLAHRIINRTNSHRKRPGPVVLCINERAISPDNIKVIWDGELTASVERLSALLKNLEYRQSVATIDKGPENRPEKIAA